MDNYEGLVKEIAPDAYLVYRGETKNGSKNRKTHIVKVLGENLTPNNSNEGGSNTIGYGRSEEQAWEDAYWFLRSRIPNPFPNYGINYI